MFCIFVCSRASNERHGSISDAESDEENEEGDYTVYECPGLASVNKQSGLNIDSKAGNENCIKPL